MKSRTKEHILLPVFLLGMAAFALPGWSHNGEPGKVDPVVEEEILPDGRKNVKGFICDENGEAIIGASVVEKGKRQGVITDVDGTFTLTVTANASIVISYIGYQTKEISVKGKSAFMAIPLLPDTKMLDEVVVVGFGKQKKESLVGAVQSVKPEDLKMTSSSLTTSFAGNVPGIIARQTKGEPGYDEAEFYIRGVSTFGSSTAPLIILDGVEINATMMNNIPPESIASFSVLKDATATSLYGSRGANGVIQVTTKRAKMGTSQVSLSAKFGVSTLQRGKLRMMNGAEYYDYLYEAFTNAGTLQNQVWLQPYLREANFDWWDYATQNALTQNYNIAYQFGNDKIRSYIAGDYYTEEGTIKGYDYQRFTLRSNTDYIVNKRLTL